MVKIDKKYAATADGSAIYYEVYGHGYPLFMLHGNNNDGRYFSKQIPFFSQYFQVFVIDSRAHGKSSNRAPELTFTLLATDLAAVMAQEKIQHADLLGFSDGANVALKFTELYPQQVKRLVLNAGNLNIRDIKWLPRIASYLQAGFFRILAFFFPRFQQQAAIYQLTLKDVGLNQTALTKIAVPTLILVGEHDLIKDSHSRYLAETLPNARLEVIPKYGHTVARQDAKIFNRSILAFLQGKEQQNEKNN